MAEALAVIGVVASIVQLVDFGSKVLLRLNEYQSSAGEIPKSYQHVKTQLPVLLRTLEQMKSAIEIGLVENETKDALLPAIDGCQKQIKLLDDVIEKVLPLPSDSWAKRSKKSILSLLQDAKVQKIWTDLGGYIQILTLYHSNVSASRPLTGPLLLSRPTPSSTVPFSRDPDFIDHGILSNIHKKCSLPASRAALVGLGGVGKSQLAIELSYRLREESPETWVFWVHAGTAVRFEEGYRRIADKAKIPGTDKPEADTLKLVYNWLCDEANGRWHIILDNADDASVFYRSADHGSDQAARSLLDFLPQSPNGSILITSRFRDLASRLTGRDSDVIKVEPLDQTDALALFHKKLPGNINFEDVTELVRVLDYMPLAITQAATYISRRAPRMTVSKYLHDLRASDEGRASLLEKDGGDSRRDSSALNSIIATWQISFKHIRKERPPAARLLSLMSLFNRQGIPETLLHQGYLEDGDTEADFDEDIATLMSYSLVTMSGEGNEFEMHRLVQFSTKKWLEVQHELEYWKEKYIEIMDEAFPSGEYEAWKTCRELLPHSEMILSYRPTNEDYLVQWASILDKTACYLHDQGKYEQAEEMERGALEGREKALGKEHPDTLESLNNLAVVLEKQGMYKQAGEIHQIALEEREKALGKEHPDTSESLNNLAAVLQRQGKYEQAEEMYRQQLEPCKKALGKEHPDTLRTLGSLARVLHSQGKYEQAEEMQRRALEGREKALGKEHPDTLISLNNLAMVLQSQGKYEQVEEMQRRALEGSEKALGKENPDTLISLNNLALVLRSQGKYKQAEEMHRQALKGFERVLGKENPDTLVSVWSLALLLVKREQFQEALTLYQRASTGFEKVLGRDHPDTKYCCELYSDLLKRLDGREDSVS